jgi:hypothetical protein
VSGSPRERPLVTGPNCTLIARQSCRLRCLSSLGNEPDDGCLPCIGRSLACSLTSADTALASRPVADRLIRSAASRAVPFTNPVTKQPGKVPAWKATTAGQPARRGTDHRRSVSALAAPGYSPETVLSGTKRARGRGGAAIIQVITAPSSSHAAQTVSSPQLTPG